MRSVIFYAGLFLVSAVWTSCATTPAPTSPDEVLSAVELPPLPWEVEVAALPQVASPLVAIVGGTVMTAAGPTIEDGVVVMENGRLLAVGPRNAIEVPSGARIVDARGRFVTPGVIDTHSHMGVYASPHVRATSDGNEMTSPTTAEVRAADSFWPQDPALPRAVAAGVTTIQVLPGSANLIGGQGAVMKMHLGLSVSEMLFPGAPRTIKMACGENPKRVYGGRNQAPSTRMGNVAGYRAAFQGAIEYGRQWEAWQHEYAAWSQQHESFQSGASEDAEDPGRAPDPPARDFGNELLLGTMEGDVLLQVHCYRADEMVRFMEVGDEFGFRVRAFHHAVEAYKIRDILAEREVSISTWADWWGFKLEAYDAIEENLAVLTQAGVRAVMHSDDAMLIQRLNQEAAKGMTAGRRQGIDISREQALEWITINAAWTLGVHEQTGSLEVGKMADVVVWSADPLSVYARADQVYIDGLLRFDRSRQDIPRQSDFELGQDLDVREGRAAEVAE